MVPVKTQWNNTYTESVEYNYWPFTGVLNDQSAFTPAIWTLSLIHKHLSDIPLFQYVRRYYYWYLENVKALEIHLRTDALKADSSSTSSCLITLKKKSLLFSILALYIARYKVWMSYIDTWGIGPQETGTLFGVSLIST